MTIEGEGLPVVVSNTGPLISAFQSDSFALITALFGTVHISETCMTELIGHGWEEALARFGSRIVSHKLTDSEAAQVAELARRIAAHPTSKDSEPGHHLGEAEVMVLVQRPELAGTVLLLDELAARAIAAETGLDISGFAGVLLLAVDEGLLTADEVRERLERCQRQGTHYNAAFIERIYQAAKESER
jgi:predicted nucleic acid-binding protein